MFGLGSFSRKIGSQVSICQWFSSRSPLRFSNGTRHSSISRRNFLQSSHRKIWYFVSGEKSYWSKRYTDPSYFSIAKPSNLYRTFNKINMTEFHVQTKPKDWFFRNQLCFQIFISFFRKMTKSTSFWIANWKRLDARCNGSHGGPGSIFAFLKIHWRSWTRHLIGWERHLDSISWNPSSSPWIYEQRRFLLRTWRRSGC